MRVEDVFVFVDTFVSSWLKLVEGEADEQKQAEKGLGYDANERGEIRTRWARFDPRIGWNETCMHAEGVEGEVGCECDDFNGSTVDEFSDE